MEKEVVLQGTSHRAWFQIWEGSLVSISVEIRTFILPCSKAIAGECFFIQVIFSFDWEILLDLDLFPFGEVISSLPRRFFDYPTIKCLLINLHILQHLLLGVGSNSAALILHKITEVFVISFSSYSSVCFFFFPVLFGLYYPLHHTLQSLMLCFWDYYIFSFWDLRIRRLSMSMIFEKDQ